MAVSGTYYTVTDKAFFIGTVALLNSLRLTGNEGEFVALDCGLTPSQRARLAQHCRVEPARRQDGFMDHPLKPVAWQPDVPGAVVMIDSDMLITGSLDPLLRDAANGRIATFVDWRMEADGSERRFGEWQSALELAGPPRRQPHVCSGLIAFAVEAWPQLLDRWRDVSQRARRASKQFEGRKVAWKKHPYLFIEQDSLNAILMSEVAPEALALYDHWLAPTTYAPAPVEIDDVRRVRCVHGGRDTLLLHYTGRPKPWEQNLWVVAPYPAFTDLLPRVLFADDVTFRLDPSDVPVWLRPGLRGGTIRGGRGALQAALRRGSNVLPAPVRAQVRARVRTRATL